MVDSSKFVLRFYYDWSGPSDITENVVTCPPTNDSGWTLCEGEFLVTEEMALSSVEGVFLKFMARGIPTAIIDFKDISIHNIHGAINSLVFKDENIVSCWDTGAELLVTPSTVKYDDWQTRRIGRSPFARGNGRVIVPLSESIAGRFSNNHA